MFGKKKEMSESEKKAKLAALGEANKMASGMMKDGISGLKKVTVSSDSKEGLKKGLDKAEELVEDEDKEDSNPFAKFKKDKESSPFGKSEDDSEDSSDDSEEYEDATEDMDEDELDAEIERLMQLKEKLQE